MVSRSVKCYASHYVCYAGQLYGKSVVEMEDEHVSRIFPLSGEMESTHWLGGVIVLSPCSNLFLNENISSDDLQNLLSSKDMPIESDEEVFSSSIYAYHLEPVNLFSGSLLPDSRLRRL